MHTSRVGSKPDRHEANKFYGGGGKNIEVLGVALTVVQTAILEDMY